MNETNALLSMLKLKLNIDHPSVEESYAYGYEAALVGVSEEDNPYVTDTRAHELWAEGWWAGFYGEQPAFSIEKETLGLDAVNEEVFHPTTSSLLIKMLEITSVIGVVALVGYQVLELVA